MKIMISAGEVSGDVHGSYLVKELKKLRPDIYFFGMGSEKLAAEGVDVKFDISKRGTIGIFEALPNVLPIYLTFLKMKKLALKEKPDLILLVDSQGFNLPFAKFCKKAGLKTVYSIAPQEWLWGSPAGVKQVAETADLIVAIFEKEYAAYKKAGANVVYFGHPLVDIIRSNNKQHRLGIRHSSLVVALCPGSRTREIKGLLPILLKAAGLIQKVIPDIQFLIPAASKEIYRIINSTIVNCSLLIVNLKVIEGQTREILASSDLALCTSGTINLEASLLGVPNIMVYKLSPLTYWIGKHILKIDKKIKYFSMPNLLLDEKIIPELIMGDAQPEKIAAEALAILKDPSRQRKMKAAFEKLREKVGSPGATSRIAEAIAAFLPALP